MCVVCFNTTTSCGIIFTWQEHYSTFCVVYQSEAIFMGTRGVHVGLLTEVPSVYTKLCYLEDKDVTYFTFVT